MQIAYVTGGIHDEPLSAATGPLKSIVTLMRLTCQMAIPARND